MRESASHGDDPRRLLSAVKAGILSNLVLPGTVAVGAGESLGLNKPLKGPSDSGNPFAKEALDFERLENLSAEHIKTFLGTLSDEDRELMQCRWGLGRPLKTLEEVGLARGVTRERIRQIQGKHTRRFTKSFTLSSNEVWSLIELEKKFELPGRLPQLRAHFNTDKDFFRFIEMMLGEHKIPTVTNAGVTEDILDEIFANQGAPLCLQMIEQALLQQADTQIDKTMATDTATLVKYLEEKGAVKVTVDGVIPTKLSKGFAVACIVSMHPQGLPWGEISERINTLGICRTPFSLERKDGQGFLDSSLVYLSGLRMHGHIKYAEYSHADIESTFDEIRTYIEASGEETVHLNQIYTELPSLHELDYFVTRYLVKMTGKDAGIHFFGKSGSDSVSLIPNFKSVSQDEVILNVLRKRAVPLTKIEISELLVSKSAAHASFYLHELIKQGKVIHVEPHSYTLPELAYEGMDTEIYLQEIGRILLSESRPVDSSYLCEEVNKRLSQIQSRQFYSSLAIANLSKRGWQRARTLFSIEKLHYSGISDLLENVCDLEKGWEFNASVVMEHVLVSEEVARQQFRHLRQMKKRDVPSDSLIMEE